MESATILQPWQRTRPYTMRRTRDTPRIVRTALATLEADVNRIARKLTGVAVDPGSGRESYCILPSSVLTGRTTGRSIERHNVMTVSEATSPHQPPTTHPKLAQRTTQERATTSPKEAHDNRTHDITDKAGSTHPPFVPAKPARTVFVSSSLRSLSCLGKCSLERPDGPHPSVLLVLAAVTASAWPGLRPLRSASLRLARLGYAYVDNACRPHHPLRPNLSRSQR